MSLATTPPSRAAGLAPPPVWAVWCLVLAMACSVGLHPVGWAIASVFLLAGPHNFQEARYVLGRLPARPGKLWPYFLCSLLGWLGLSLGFVAFYLTELPGWALPAWNSALVVWVGLLGWLRSREHPRRNAFWLLPACLALLSLNFWSPWVFSLSLVYLHPVMALCIADRELQAQRHPWRRLWRQALWVVPLGLLVTLSASAPLEPPQAAAGLGSFFDLPGNTLAWLAVHTYLELLHYAVWIALLPAVAVSLGKHGLERMPLLRKAQIRVRLARLTLGLAALAVLGLWWAFQVDYAATREAYFALAIGHVLVEFPFLFRSL